MDRMESMCENSCACNDCTCNDCACNDCACNEPVTMKACVLRVCCCCELLVCDLCSSQEVLVRTEKACCFQPGQKVCIEYNGIMTKSIPPQINAICIEPLNNCGCNCCC